MPPLTLTAKLLREPRLATLPARAWRMFLSIYVLADEEGNLPEDAAITAMLGEPQPMLGGPDPMTELHRADLIEFRGTRTCVKIRRKPSQQAITVSPAVMEFPCRDGVTWKLTADFAQEIRRLFPDVNVEMQVALAKEWIGKSKGNRKRSTGMRAFLMNWMKRTDDTKKTTGGRTAPLPTLP